jgi:integrase
MSIASKNDLISRGFDRDVDYEDMKNKLISDMSTTFNNYNQLEPKYRGKKRICINRLIYIIIAMIQLRNGCRISEAVEAFRTFVESGINDKAIVKIAKSESIKYDKKTQEKYITKPRYREIMYPVNWIENKEIIELLKKNMVTINHKFLRKKVLDFMLTNYKCNTHSLRYAFINFMLNDKKCDMATVAKFVGHSDLNQLVRYTQLKKTRQLFNLDI